MSSRLLSGVCLVLLSTPALAVASDNDDFDLAEDVGVAPFSIAADVAGASADADDPAACVTTGETVWYSYTADEDAVVLLDTFGSDYDTTLSVWTGDRGSLTLVACNDDSGGLQSAVEIDVTAGETYWVMVGAFGTTAAANLVLNGELYTPPDPPANDDFADATEVDGIPFSDSVDTLGATPEDTDGDCRGGGPTVWYSYTALEDGTLAGDTFGSDYDTTLSVWTGAAGALTNVACNDDTLGLQSRVRFDVVAGTTYYIMVGAYASGDGGDLSFNLDVAPPPLELDVAIDSGRWSPIADTVTVNGHVDCSDATYVTVYGALTQRGGTRSEAGGSFWASVDCEDTAEFTADVWTDYGRLISGPTEVTTVASGTSWVTYEADSVEVDETVRFTASSH